MFVVLELLFMSLYFCFFEEQKKHIEIWAEEAIAWCVLLLAKTEILSLFAKVNANSSLAF